MLTAIPQRVSALPHKSRVVKMKPENEQNEDATSDETHEGSQTDVPSETEAEDVLGREAIEDMTRGMVYASLAITDDKEGTLKKVS